MLPYIRYVWKSIGDSASEYSMQRCQVSRMFRKSPEFSIDLDGSPHLLILVLDFPYVLDIISECMVKTEIINKYMKHWI